MSARDLRSPSTYPYASLFNTPATRSGIYNTDPRNPRRPRFHPFQLIVGPSRGSRLRDPRPIHLRSNVITIKTPHKN